MRTLEEVLVFVVFGVLAAREDVVGGETLPQGVHVLWLALVWSTHIALEARG